MLQAISYNKDKHPEVKENAKKSQNTYIYFASIGLIGIPGTIDKLDEENPMPLSRREGMSKSCL